MEFILASASPRRKELLSELIQDFTIQPAKGEEKISKGLTPCELVKTLARQKAEEISSKPENKGKAVLGSDTVVAFEGEVLGKPKDEADARRMLGLLSGKTHEVYTGVCLITPLKTRTEAACTKVRFFPLTKEQIQSYIDTGSPMDKAGAYGIQDGGLVEEIEGSFSNVVGLPIELCERIFKEEGLIR